MHICTHRVLFDEQNCITYRKIDGTGDHRVKLNKSESERQN